MKFEVIYADPPWRYQNFSDAKNGAAKSHYKTYTALQMAEWDIASIAADNSLLFLWATWPKLEECLAVMNAWGFEYVTTPFVWSKIYRNGSPYCGLGFWTRSGTEFVMMGKRGKGLPREKDAMNVRQVVEAPVGKHSEKPCEVRERIVKLVGDVPRIELFARERAIGWEATGLELDGLDIVEALKRYGT